MKQRWIPRIGAAKVLEVREAPDPAPGPGEVRVAVEAAGVNFADVVARQGLTRRAAGAVRLATRSPGASRRWAPGSTDRRSARAPRR
ncbi:MAG: hypothetical protein KIT58_00370 [Planctomycetota bacterium]|nr:hypothetical protein [Planctomycetota bacterium]